MSIFTRSDGAILRRLGEEWTTTLNGEELCFHGVFDAVNRLETDTMGQAVIIAGSSLTCQTQIASQFVLHQQLTDHKGKTWYSREALAINDGALSIVTLTETTQ
jgi:hypothetical protein